MRKSKKNKDENTINELFDTLDLHKPMLNIASIMGDKRAEVLLAKEGFVRLLTIGDFDENFEKAIKTNDEVVLQKYIDFFMQLQCEFVNFNKDLKHKKRGK